MASSALLNGVRDTLEAALFRGDADASAVLAIAVTVAAVVVGAVALSISSLRIAPVYIDFPRNIGERANAVQLPRYKLGGKNVVVTGGNGFVGRHLVDALVANGCNVTVFDIVVPSNTGNHDGSSSNDQQGSVQYTKGDLTQLDQVKAAFKGADTVFHVASPNPNGTSPRLFEAVNVCGTTNVVEACRAVGVPRLVFTSSASVVFDGADQPGADETVPYPTRFRDEYSRTKAQAERIVLEAAKPSDSSPHALRTVAVRPHGIFGPRDPQLVPTLVTMAKRGKTKFALGRCDNIVDFTYVGNVIHGHLLAAEKLASDDAREFERVNGQAYFITNDSPISFWKFMGEMLDALAYPPPTWRMPARFVLALAHLAQFFARMTGVAVTLSPARIVIATTHHWYRCDKAKHDLGYTPLWSMQEALYLTQQFFKHYKNPRPLPRSGRHGARGGPQTKADVGAGKNPVNLDNLPAYSYDEVAQHATRDDLWIIVDDYVYDVTDYIDRHPGGDALLNKPGRDNTRGFYGAQHPDSVRDTIKRYLVGELDIHVPDVEYTAEEVSKHTNPGDVWIIVEDRVYDISQFVDKHPGGREILLRQAGKDVTEGFFGPQHKPETRDLLKRYVLGRLAGSPGALAAQRRRKQNAGDSPATEPVTA